jgi:phosphoglycolate phosphatase
MISPNILILRVGDVNSNFKNSVLDRIPLNSHIKPIWGYNSEKALSKYEPTYIAKHPQELLSIILNQRPIF